ncbi:putative motility protein [Paenibacillus roseipurpureus]|uniref:Motility protein n=1 Tax=Paenibacillus roseopurpureus TaxID=2918901 RepID=A0AA96LQM6_9BACL|nr:putative motility protein [Paenibacillus sp. MBLB1832]WNR46472.1 putative motility protein [Paenibacillus sp. MBLB1832]
MNVNSALTAINSTDGLKQAVGIQMLKKTSDTQTDLTTTLIQDFANNQAQVTAPAAPHLGANLDIRV